MKLEIKTPGIGLTAALSQFIGEKVERALSRYKNRISSVLLLLKDNNGPRGGVDKRCLLQITIANASPVVIQEINADAYAAVALATGRAERAVARVFSRRQQRR